MTCLCCKGSSQQEKSSKCRRGSAKIGRGYSIPPLIPYCGSGRLWWRWMGFHHHPGKRLKPGQGSILPSCCLNKINTIFFFFK